MPLEFFRRHAPELTLVFFGLIFALVVFAPLEGEVESFLTAALDVALFVILAMLAYLAEDRHRAFRWAAVVWLLVLIGGLAAVTAGFGVMSILPAEAIEDEFDPDSVDLAMAAEVALLLLVLCQQYNVVKYMLPYAYSFLGIEDEEVYRDPHS